MSSNEQADSVSLAKRFLGVIAKPKETFVAIAEEPRLPLGLLIFGTTLIFSVGITSYMFSFKIHVSNLVQLPAPDPVGAYGGLVAPGVARPDYAAIATQSVTFRLLFLLTVLVVSWLVAQLFKKKESAFTTLLSAVGHAFAVMVVGAMIVTPLVLVYPEQNNEVTQVAYEGAVLSDVSFRGTFFNAATTGVSPKFLSDLNSSRVDISRAVSDQISASEGESILTGLVIENVTVGGVGFSGNITVEKAVLSSIETEDWTGRLTVVNASRALVSFAVIRDKKMYSWDRERALDSGNGWSPLLPEPGALDLLLLIIPLALRLWIIGLGSVAMYGIYGVGVPAGESILARTAALLKLIIVPVIVLVLSLIFLPNILFTAY